MSPLALTTCQPLVRACLANVVGDAIETPGVWDFRSSKDLGRSIVEGRSMMIIDY
jgi:hypothetical protein